MEGVVEAAESEQLVSELRDAGEDLTHIVAILWTWLDSHLLDLGARRTKPPAIRRAALRAEPYSGLSEEDLERLRIDPIGEAALLLGRIGFRLGDPDYALAESTVGFGGVEVIVFTRLSELIRRIGGGELPPSALEHPSLSTLVPALVVVPAEVAGIRLEAPAPEGPEWEVIQRGLELGLLPGAGEPLEFHLDTLGSAGFSAWEPDPDPDLGVGALLEAGVTDPERAEALEAVEGAIEAAAGPTRILILPELAVDDVVLEAIRTKLAGMAGRAPALTVLGRYHRRSAEDGDQSAADAPELGRYVNEALVLGPGGGTLWSHRKLTSAQGTVMGADGPVSIVEDIRPGRSLTVVNSALGNLGLVICLDAIAAHSRERLAASPVNVLLVPSLSPKVRRHRSSLQHLVQVLWGSAFVCNRSPEPGEGEECWNEEENRSFWALQRRDLELPEPDPARPSFVFRLDESEK